MYKKKLAMDQSNGLNDGELSNSMNFRPKSSKFLSHQNLQTNKFLHFFMLNVQFSDSVEVDVNDPLEGEAEDDAPLANGSELFDLHLFWFLFFYLCSDVFTKQKRRGKARTGRS